MLCNNHPAVSYISWFGLVIIDETETPYMINTGKSCMKYIYWDMDNPYVLRESNTWIEESSTRKMIYINDNGTGTEVPHDNITIYYNDTGSGASVKLIGEALGKYDELNGKYMTVQEDVNGIKEVLGSTETGSGNSLIERINVLEKTAEGTTEKISIVEKSFSDNKELENLRNNINISLINLGEALSYYENSISEMSKDLEVSSEEKSDISLRQTNLLDAYTSLSQYHQVLIQRLQNSQEDNNVTIIRLNNALDYLNTSINDLNSIVNTAISDNTIAPSEVTIMLNAISVVALRNSDYKTLVSDSILLGIGGRLIESVLDIKKTSNEFNQTISKVTEEIDGETGLKVQVTKNATAIKQNADTISLECVKFNETTAQLTVGDGVIKLDAGKVLMTGTLTWDSLDDVAKTNLKGADGADGTAEYVMLVGDQMFKYDKDGVPNTNSITLTAQVFNITNPVFDWYYKNEDVSTEWVYIPSDVNSSTFTLTHNSSIWKNNVNSITIRVTCNNLYDDMTIVKLYDGAVGQSAMTVTVSGEQLFRYDNDFTGIPSPTSIVLNGYKNNITSNDSRWYYRINNTDSWTEITSSRGTDSLVISHDSSYFGNSKILMIRYEVETYADIISIAKISDGSDGYFILLTNENHSVPCDENGNYTADSLREAYTYVRAYKGLKEITFSLTKTDNGCTSVYNTSTKRLEITSLTKNIATVTMNITIDGNSFQKVMTITKSIKGEKGENGTGINVLGELDNVSQLPTNGIPGDAYIIGGLIYVWSENTNGWSDGVPFRGEQGLPGKDGIDGRTTYLHIKYSDDGKTFTSNNGEDSGTWLGQYTDFIEDDSTIFNDYTWTKIKGQDGDNGIVANLTNDSHTIPTNSDGSYDTNNATEIFSGCNSKIELSYNGTVLTSGVRYSNTKSSSITGSWDSTTGTYTVTGLSSDTGYVDLKATYNGVTYTKRFTVSKNKSGQNGLDGNDGYTINITNNNHSFVANADGKIETQQSITTTVIAFKGTTQITPSFGALPTVNGLTLNRNGTTITITAPVGTNLALHGSFNIPVIIDGKTFNQAFNYSKVNCGEDGENGYTVVLTNEAHIFPCANNGNIATAISTTTQVRAFKGTTEITPTIGTLPSVNGLTLSKSGTTITIRANTGTSLASSGSFNIPITVDGVSFTKTFSWSKSFAGANGTFEGAIPEWITEWDNGKTTINGTSVITPKLFAGTVSNGTPTGVAIGKNVFGTSGTYGNVNGIVGYNSGTKTYEFNVDGSILVGGVTGNYLSWNGNELEIVADNISIGTSMVVSETTLNEAMDNIINSSTYLKMDNDGFAIVSQGDVVRIKSEDELDAIFTEYNNRFETLENGEGFAMVFDQKYAEYGVGGAVSTARNVRNNIDFQSDGSIRLHGSDSNFALLLEKDQLSFQQNGNAIAWMSTDTLYIRDGEFTNSLRLGNFKWIPRENGNLSFIYI